jgi:hypothetical protein
MEKRSKRFNFDARCETSAEVVVQIKFVTQTGSNEYHGGVFGTTATQHSMQTLVSTTATLLLTR